MKRESSITMFYVGVALISAVILGAAFFVRSRLPEPELPPMVETGGDRLTEWFPIERDLAGVNQDGEAVKLSDLRGKVWVVAQFFAVCPHCAERNGAELRELYELFRSHPDFHIVCVTVDPETDGVAKLADYASSLGAETRNWWFMNAGDEKATHAYLENELKFFGIRERTDPLEVEAQGRFSHDLAFMLVNRDFRVIGKWPLAEARTEPTRTLEPKLYEVLKQDLHARLRQELGGNPDAGEP